MDEPDLPLDHIVRPPLPWREPEITECGRPLGDVRSVVTRGDIERKVKQQGKQRAAFTTCMTCASTSDRWRAANWDEDPIDAMDRWVSRGTLRWRGDDPSVQRLTRELRAIAALVEAHRDEFDDLVAGLEAAPDLNELRRQRGKKARRH